MNAVAYEASQQSENLRANLAQLFEERDVTKRTFCRDVGISRTLLYHFMDGKGDVTISVAAKMAKYFDLALGDLLDGRLQHAEKMS